LGDKIKDFVGTVCSTHGRREMRTKFLYEKLRRRNHLGGLDVMGLIHLNLDRDQWWASVITVKELQIS
jgi:hypothetical protein